VRSFQNRGDNRAFSLKHDFFFKKSLSFSAIMPKSEMVWYIFGAGIPRIPAAEKKPGRSKGMDAFVYYHHGG
jgi:hypothetical protein